MYCARRLRDRHMHAAYPTLKPAMKIDDWMRRVSMGFRPVITPAIFSSPRCDDIMILNAENVATCGTFYAATAAEPVNASPQAPSCAIRISRTTRF
jgi:hypothetical protein